MLWNNIVAFVSLMAWPIFLVVLTIVVIALAWALARYLRALTAKERLRIETLEEELRALRASTTGPAGMTPPAKAE